MRISKKISAKEFNEGIANGSIIVNGRRGFKKKNLKKQKSDDNKDAKKKKIDLVTPNKYPNYIPKNFLYQEKIGRKNVYRWSDSDIQFDSEGEAYVYLWLLELKAHGYIEKIECQPEPFVLSEAIKRPVEIQLKTKVKEIKESVESSQIYTPDFLIYWTDKAYDDNLVIEFYSTIKKQPHHIFSFVGESYIEAKPDALNLKVYDDNNMIRLFRSKQKAVYEKFNIYINLIFHNKLFSETFMPSRYTWSNKASQSRLIRYDYQTLEEYVERVKNSIIK